MLRHAITVSTVLLVSSVLAADEGRPPDISTESVASLHHFVDRAVVVRGRFSLRGKSGPMIDTGKAQILLKPEDPPDLDATLEGKSMIVVGTLRYDAAKSVF